MKTRIYFLALFTAMSLLVVGCGGGGSNSSSKGGGAGSNTSSRVGPSGGEITLSGGESATIPAGSTTKMTSVDFTADKPSVEVGEEMQSYLFTSDHELESVNFSIPVTLPNITSSDDLHAVYVREDGAMKTLTVAYDSNSSRATFSLANNWTFAPLLPAGGSLKSSLGTSSGKKSYILLMKKKAAISSASKSKLIQMPYYEQPGGTCWATSSKMLTHGLSTASKAHLETKNIYELMGALQIGMNDGFNAFFKGKSLAKILEVNYGNYFLWSSIRNKMLKELDKGHPLIYSGTFMSIDAKPEKITHVVLIVGYEYDAKGNLVFVMHDSRNKGVKSMYTKMAWKDMQIDQYLPTEAVTLFWSDTIPPSSNSKFTLGIPTHGQFGAIYFQGKKTDKFKSVRYYLQFSPSVSKGYIWSTQQVDPSPETTFRENVNELIMKMPVYNSGSTPNSAFVSVEVYEKAHPTNKVQASQSVSVDSHGQEYVTFDLNLDDLVKNLGEDVSECAVSIKLSESGTVSTWDIFDGFKLKKKSIIAVYGDAWITATFKQGTRNTTYLTGQASKTEVIQPYLFPFGVGGSSKYEGSANANTISINFYDSNNYNTTYTGQFNISVDDIKNPKMIQQFSFSGTETIIDSFPISWYDTEKKEKIKDTYEVTTEVKNSGSANNIPLEGVVKDNEGDQKYIFTLDGKNACSYINSVKSTKKTTHDYPADYLKYVDEKNKKETDKKNKIVLSGGGTETYSDFTCDDDTHIQVDLWFKK